MDAARWERVKEICLAASERSADSLTAYVEDACAGDEALRAEVESLLDQFEQEPQFFEEPIVRITGDLPMPSEAEGQGSIGPYEIVRPLGQGGMGEVFLAVRERDDFRQSVALKVIRRGMDTDEVLGRFRVERRILASLHHPNIAQLLDGGATADGRPYFVMEYIEGVPLDEYCDRHRLSVRQRLDLFLVICSAVQHAHQNLVVHRDLKPSNILVGAEGVPKLLDFGIGKVLDPGTALGAVETRTDLRVLTPRYAAPEQVRGETVTTATDVY